MQMSKPWTTLAAVTAGALFAMMLTAGPASASETRTPSQGMTFAAPLDPATSTVLDELASGVDASSLTFDAHVPLARGVSVRDVQDYAVGYASQGGQVTGVALDAGAVEAMRSEMGMLACKGRNSHDYTGLQLNTYIDSCLSAEIVHQLAIGGGAVALAGAISAATGVGAAAAGVIAAAMALASGLVASCASGGRGAVFHMIPPSAALWCNGQ